MDWRRWRLIGVILCGVVVGCTPTPERPPSGPAQPEVKLPPSEAYLACQAELTEIGIDFDPIDDFQNDQGCGIHDGVRVRATTVKLTQPIMVTCDMASTVVAFEINVMHRLADRYLHQDIVQIDHAGSYDCRPMRGRKTGLSEHAYGRAFDITGFRLADGSVVSVEQDWSAGGEKQAFLRQLARRACQIFGVVLTPNHDADHHNHIHLDIGKWKLCGM